MKKFSILALALIAVFGVQSAKAWGKWGHRISAYIAEQHLTEKANAECRRYLQHSLPYYASWQDWWRYCKGFENVCDAHVSYVDTKYKVWGEKGDLNKEVSTRIDKITKELSNGRYLNMPDSIVAMNVKLLIHMVGDMHCPSHVYYHSDSNFPMKKRIVVRGATLQRHTFWDGSPQHLHPKWNIERFHKVCDTYSPKQIKSICKGSTIKWAEENARKVIPTFDYWEEGQDIKELSKENRVKIESMMREQLAYGGYRLAHILNKIFK